MVHSYDAALSIPTMDFATGESLEPLEQIRLAEGVDYFAIALAIVEPPVRYAPSLCQCRHCAATERA